MDHLYTAMAMHMKTVPTGDVPISISGDKTRHVKTVSGDLPHYPSLYQLQDLRSCRRSFTPAAAKGTLRITQAQLD
jgi:hypothetical protein